MKPWQLNRRVNHLSSQLDTSAESEIRIDFNSLTEAERLLFESIDEILDKYAPAMPPKDVIKKNADLWHKGLEIFARRATELFVFIMPASLCCDELEEWYFKIYFYNFVLDWMDQVKSLRNMPKKQYQELFAERKEMGMLDIVFRLPKNKTETSEKEPKP